MRPSALAFLLTAAMRGKRMRNAAVMGGLTVGMLALGLSTVAGLGTSRSLQRHLEALFPDQRIVVTPATVELLMLQADAITITPETVAAVRALPGVVRLSPEATVRFPLSAKGNLMGKTYSTDLTVTGIEPWLLGEEAPEDFSYDSEADSQPTVLSHYFLDLYNTALAESNSLPKFNASAIIGRHIVLKLGESTMHLREETRRTREVKTHIAGLTRNPDLLGLLVPLEVVEEFNAWYGIEDKCYRALHVELVDSEAVEALKPVLAAMNLEVRDRMAPWRKALTVVRLVGIAFMALGVLVFGLALAYLGSVITWMLSERRRELALFRALGASPRQVMTLLATEVGTISFLGIGAGIALAAAVLYYGNGVYLEWRAGRVFLPEALFAVPWWWLALLGVGCWTIAMALSLSQVVAGTRMPISGALTKNE